MNGPLVRAEEIAELLGCSLSAVYSMAARGDLPSYKVGSRGVRFALDEVVAAIRRPARDEAHNEPGGRLR